MIFFKKHEPLKMEDLKYFEHKNIEIPDDYRNFLIQYNGGRPENDCIDFKDSHQGTMLKSIFGFTKDEYGSLEDANIMYKERIPKNTIVIADDAGGNRIIMSISGDDYGKIYFWDHNMEADDEEEPDYSNLTLVADSFDEFINNLKSSEEELDD